MRTDHLIDAAVLAAGGVEVQYTEPVLTVRLARPEARNAQTPATWRALAAIGEKIPLGARAVILKADGASFSAGLDRRMFADGIDGEPSLLELSTMSAERAHELIDGYQRGFTWLREIDAVSIAIVQGHAVGAGFQLALAADMIVAVDDATFCMKEPALGLVPDLVGTWPLVEAVGYSRALEICATSRWVTAEEAVRYGIAIDVVGMADVEQTVARIVDQIVAAPMGAVAETKHLLRLARGRTVAEQRLAERQAQARRIAALATGD